MMTDISSQVQKEVARLREMNKQLIRIEIGNGDYCEVVDAKCDTEDLELYSTSLGGMKMVELFYRCMRGTGWWSCGVTESIELFWINNLTNREIEEIITRLKEAVDG